MHMLMYIFQSLVMNMTGKKTLEGLQSARGFVQYRVGKSLRIHTIPEVRFYVDTSIEEGVTMVNLLEKLEKESVKNDNGDSSSKS